MCAVQYDEAEASEGEEEAGGEPLHDVLSVDPVRHERHRPAVPVLVRRGSHTRRLHDHVVDYT